jgi:hypothetical protein
MAGFLPDQVVTNLQGLLQQLHETLAVEDIVVYQKARKVVNSESANYNFLFNANATDDTIDYVPVTGVYKARVVFPTTKQDVGQFGMKQDRRAEDQINVKIKEGMIRITVDPTGAAAVRTCERIVYKDKVYSLDSEETPRGWQADQFFEFYLKSLN